MNDTIKKKCLMCNEEFSVSRDHLWKFLCPTHTQEFYIPLRRNHSFQSALHLIELAILLDDIEMLRDRFMGKPREEPKVSEGFRSVVGTAEWQKLKETAAV
ncbi:hypothetical protein DesfrDRAFT_0801 [Solidesulfovibrio fructosivorans JJ]]|uniref:Uncharacterized protein n=1 Tax=Solidesulfovibrio fructosivorans JJ] TaxID=596151 RepID=E1JT52_SOLFR|nr:hypothetical protein [Solidesulfovibrio fructosivorans]EFL52312.1 hypothetical protein DesfrDRAFT_0801 [Solidesulfovibrio fructosivorans JJ]]